MKNKKVVMIIRILLIMVVIASIANNVLGYDPTSWKANESSSKEMSDIVGDILGFVQVLGSAISVIVVVVIGIKYMWASTEEKFEIKQTAVYYVIGAILVFATVNIVTIIYNIIW